MTQIEYIYGYSYIYKTPRLSLEKLKESQYQQRDLIEA